MKSIKSEEMLMGAEVRLLALFVKNKLAEVESRNNSLGWELSCEFKTKSLQMLCLTIKETECIFSREEM